MKVVKQDGEDKEDQGKDEVKLQGPMAMIITEKEVWVFLFPFQYNGSVLVTALALAPIKLFCDTTVLDPSSLFLLAFITKNRPLSDIVLQGIKFSDEQMRRYDIVTEEESKEELKKEIERLRQLVERERSWINQAKVKELRHTVTHTHTRLETFAIFCTQTKVKWIPPTHYTFSFRLLLVLSQCS